MSYTVIQPQQLKSIRKLGAGSFADVWLCWYTPADGSAKYKVAAKYVKPAVLSNELERQLFLKEVTTLKELKHRYIVQLIGVGATLAETTPMDSKHSSTAVAQDATVAEASGPFASCQQHQHQHVSQDDKQVPLSLVQEYLAGGAVNRVVAADMIKSPWQRHAYTLPDSLRWATQLAEALVYLHTQDPKVIHRDLKLSNILLTSTDFGTAEARVADFGLHTCVPQHNQQLLALSSSQVTATSHTGTAPNSRDNSGHSKDQRSVFSRPADTSHLDIKLGSQLHHGVGHNRHGSNLDPSYGSQFSAAEGELYGASHAGAEHAGAAAAVAGSLVSSTAPPSTVSVSTREYLRVQSARLVYQRTVSSRRLRTIATRTLSVPRLSRNLSRPIGRSSRSATGSGMVSGPGPSPADVAITAEVQFDATAVLHELISDSCRDALKRRGPFGRSFRQQYGQLLRAQMTYPSTVAESFREGTIRDSSSLGLKDASLSASHTTPAAEAGAMAEAARVPAFKDPSQSETAAAAAGLPGSTSAPASLSLSGLRAALSSFSSISARHSSGTSQRVPSGTSIASRVSSMVHPKATAPASTAAAGAVIALPDVPDIVEAVFQLTARTGSLVYMAPEVFLGKSYNEKADVFSFGIMLYELLHYQLLQLSIGAVANDGQAALHLYAVSMAEEGFRPPINPKLPQALQDLIQSCWSQQPEDRPSMTVVLQKLQTLQQELHLSGGTGAANPGQGSAGADSSSGGSNVPCCGCLGA